jgi:TATA-binding protein-associated factor
LFAQFTQSLDAVEEFLFKIHMPSLRYLRLDGQVPANKRSALVDAFNSDPSIKLMLLTTRVGGLGLNLTGADTGEYFVLASLTFAFVLSLLVCL